MVYSTNVVPAQLILTTTYPYTPRLDFTQMNTGTYTDHPFTDLRGNSFVGSGTISTGYNGMNYKWYLKMPLLNPIYHWNTGWTTGIYIGDGC